MKRRIVICLLVLCTLLALMPVLGLVASASENTLVATVVVDGKTVARSETLSAAFTTAAKREGSTVVLQSDLVITAGYDFKGTYTFDLNGHVITAHTPLVQTTGTVTIIDSSEAQTGAIRGIDYPALELRGKLLEIPGETEEDDYTYEPTGNIILQSGTFDCVNGDYAIYNKGFGVLYLAGTPKLEKAVYLVAAGTLCGHDGAEEPTYYDGNVVSVYYSESPIPEGAVLLIDGDAGKFDFTTRGSFSAQGIGDQVVLSDTSFLAYTATAGMVLVSLILIAIMCAYKGSVKKKITKMNFFTIPAILPFMTYMGDIQRLMMAGAALLLIGTIICFIISLAKNHKKLKVATAEYGKKMDSDPDFAAKKAAEKAELQDAIAEELPPEDYVADMDEKVVADKEKLVIEAPVAEETEDAPTENASPAKAELAAQAKAEKEAAKAAEKAKKDAAKAEKDAAKAAEKAKKDAAKADKDLAKAEKNDAKRTEKPAKKKAAKKNGFEEAVEEAFEEDDSDVYVPDADQIDDNDTDLDDADDNTTNA